MAPWDELEHYEATEAQDLTRLLRALRPPAREVQVPPPVDLAIRAAIWQAPVRRQLSTLLSMARHDLIQMLRQALADNPLLEEGARAEDADDLTDAAARYDSIWQACVPDGWEAHGLPAQPSETPGASEHTTAPPEALVADVIVRKAGDGYQVILNEEGIPRLRLRTTARRLEREGPAGEPEAMHDLGDHLRAAVWFIRGLEYRRQTLSAVAQHWVTRQRAFLDHGLAHLQPLALTEVAAALGLHASTVRRVVTNTYLATAYGIVALTAYFQGGLEASGGETRSSRTVKDRIKQLVAAEDPATPLTDQQLVEALAVEQINLARRTVTQYRRELQLPPAHRRQPHGSTARGSQLSPAEEQRVRQALEAHARRRQAESPPQRDREETSGIPPEVQETQHHRDQEALAWLHLQGIEWWRLAVDPERRAAYHDLQTALADPQLRTAVLRALRAFAQAAQAGAPNPPPAAGALTFPFVELGSTPWGRPEVEAPFPVHDLNDLMRQAIRRVAARLEVEGVSILLLDEARQELYFTVADDRRPSHEPRLREVRFPATQGIAGWVLREGQSLLVPDVDHDPRFYRGVDVRAGTKTRSLVCVPLRTQERIIGVLEAINKRQGMFTAGDVRRLEAFAEQFARALEQARAIQERYHFDVQPLIAEVERLANSAVPVDPLLGESPQMQEVARLLERVRHTTATVLLTGERGTGKDRIARILHEQGPRAQGPFIAVNCAALPETRLEAELFGDERGAFPGDTRRQPGRLERAAGGTLFLEEIDALSPALQAKLLRVLHARRFERAGGTETLTTDARIIAATHQDLEQLVARGRFRGDLFYRLNVYPIALPPLRERREDLLPLAMHFLKRSSHALGKDVLDLSEEAMRWLARYPWPGNVQELAEVIEQAVAHCQGPTVTVQDLSQALREQSRAPGSSGDAPRLPPGGIKICELEKELIRQALEQAHQNKSQAAKLLGLSRTQLRTRMRQYGLEDE